jgi:hypothetical protein
MEQSGKRPGGDDRSRGQPQGLPHDGVSGREVPTPVLVVFGQLLPWTKIKASDPRRVLPQGAGCFPTGVTFLPHGQA